MLDVFVRQERLRRTSKRAPMRRFVRDRVAAALERAKLEIEEYVAEHLQYPEAFPFPVADAAVWIREVARFRIAAIAGADYPPVTVEVLLRAWLTNRVSGLWDGWTPGVLDIDVELVANGTVMPDGTYNVEPRSVVLKAWWRDLIPLASQRFRRC